MKGGGMLLNNVINFFVKLKFNINIIFLDVTEYDCRGCVICIFTIRDILERKREKRERKKYRLLSSLSLSRNLVRNTQRLSGELENIRRHLEPQAPQPAGSYRFYPIPYKLLAEKPSSAASTPGEAQTPEVQGIPSLKQEDVKDVEVKITPVQIPGVIESSALMQIDLDPVAPVPLPVNPVDVLPFLPHAEQSTLVSLDASLDDPGLESNASGKPIVAAQIAGNPAQIAEIPGNPAQIAEIPGNPAEIAELPGNPALIPGNHAQIPGNPAQTQDLPSQRFEQSYYQNVMRTSSDLIVPGAYNRTWSRLNNMRVHRNLTRGVKTKKK